MDGGVSGSVARGDENATFREKSGSAPNPQVKKVGVTPNPDQIFASAAVRAAEADHGIFFPETKFCVVV